jgi:hypothetical protein
MKLDDIIDNDDYKVIECEKFSEETNDYYFRDKFPKDVLIKLFKFESFNEREIDEISKLSTIVINNNHFIRCVGKNYVGLDIYKKEDYWFYASVFSYGSFKCDQFEGLIELIKFLDNTDLIYNEDEDD